MNYSEYLHSDVWRTLRRVAIENASGRCQICNSRERIEVHHRVYPEMLGTESVKDLTVLCNPCHELFSLRGMKGIENIVPLYNTPETFYRELPTNQENKELAKICAEINGIKKSIRESSKNNVDVVPLMKEFLQLDNMRRAIITPPEVTMEEIKL